MPRVAQVVEFIAYGAILTLALVTLVLVKSAQPVRVAPAPVSALEDAMGRLVAGELSRQAPDAPIRLIPLAPAAPGGTARAMAGLAATDSGTRLHILATWLPMRDGQASYVARLQLAGGREVDAGPLRLKGSGRWAADVTLDVPAAAVRQVGIWQGEELILQGR